VATASAWEHLGLRMPAGATPPLPFLDVAESD
jgi:hypothetical protein